MGMDYFEGGSLDMHIKQKMKRKKMSDTEAA